MRKKILLSIGLLVCIGVAAGIYLYHKPRTAAAAQSTDFKIAAVDLYNQFETNETAAGKQYTGKILEVTGTIGEVQKTDTTLSVLLTVPAATGGINCSMAIADNGNIKTGETVTIKGKCAGFLMDVALLDALVINRK